MKKILFIAALSVGFLFAGCSSDDDNNGNGNGNGYTGLPYSELSPEDQKKKLEEQTNEFLEMASNLKDSESIDAFESLSALLNISSPFSNDKDDEEGGTKEEPAIPDFPIHPSRAVEDLLTYSTLYGVYTWNPELDWGYGDWEKEESTSELKLIFPTKDSETNNASLVISAIESNIIAEIDGKEFYLPTSANGTFYIGNKKVGNIALTSEYKNNKPVPAKTTVTANLDNYQMKTTFDKAAARKAEFSVTYNNKKMISIVADSDIDLDTALENGDRLKGKLKMVATLLTNLEFTFDSDLKKFREEIDKLGDYNTVSGDKMADIYNKYMPTTLVDKASNTTIADLVWKGEGTYDYTAYLKFNDNTLVEAEAYFQGFNSVMDKLEELFGIALDDDEVAPVEAERN
ncbi:hypothetical protein [Bacteroides sp. 224]|uniref:hypothetical protein n=1 Tax=Bacteroides sp. 224 TaxID=2302936 RepID=UPI0013D69D58|nr:hypothetical protein [Bacteroides sp. 224]